MSTNKKLDSIFYILLAIFFHLYGRTTEDGLYFLVITCAFLLLALYTHYRSMEIKDK